MAHLKDILCKFIKNVPLTPSHNEQMLQIVFSMLYMKDREIEEIDEVRKAITPHGKRDKSRGFSEDRSQIKKRGFLGFMKK